MNKQRIKEIVSPVCWHAAIGLYRLFTGKWKKLEINPNKVIVSVFGGRKYGDNPMFIVKALKEIKPDIEIVWVMHPKEKLRVPDYIRIVKKHSLKLFYEYATSKVWIDNELIHSYMQKKEGQYFLETWHGGMGFKKLYFDVQGYDESNPSYPRLKRTTELADLFLSDSDFFTDICRRAFRYEGKILKRGFPRNDIVINSGDGICAREVREELGIAPNTQILLYVPTFRDGTSDVQDKYNVDFSKLYNALKTRFGGEWKILVRLHPWLQNSPIAQSICNNQYVINATSYPDVQRLNAACDICMTDYSSTVFDALLRKIPCFVYANDIEEYLKKRGVYLDIRSLPFPCATNNQELEDNILTFSMEAYQEKLNDFCKDKGVVINGNSSMEVAEIIKGWMENQTM